jgi:protoporphyrin/coproporphyrin ferrochelatase
MSKLAVVLFNLGGPDSPNAVRPFLFNLFNDPAIIGAPGPLRWLLAHLISTRRAPVARRIYAEIGGRSPLLGLTRDQANALQARLAALGEVRVFVAMRYWHPMADETAAEVKAFDPQTIVLLPLYPQFSTTTTGSSLADWRRAAGRAGIDAPTKTVCCYPVQDGLIAAQAKLVRSGLEKARPAGTPRVLFSAHGLPERIIEKGDPYQRQVEQTAQAVVNKVGIADLDWGVCYQSRVGPLMWIGPSTIDELKRAGNDRVPVVVVPIAFVSEHSETLVELDIEYKALADAAGVPAYVRVPAVGTDEDFIDGLARVVKAADENPQPMAWGRDGECCSPAFTGCPLSKA